MPTNSFIQPLPYLIMMMFLSFLVRASDDFYPRNTTSASNSSAAESVEATMPSVYFCELAELKVRYKLYSEAEKLYQLALQKATDATLKTRCQSGMAFVLEEQGRCDEAFGIWERLASSKDPMVAERARLILGQRQAASGKLNAAVAQLEDVALYGRVLIFRKTAATKLSALLHQHKCSSQKLNLYQKLQKKRPEDSVLLDLVLDLQKDHPAARVAVLTGVAKTKPLDVHHSELLGSALIELGRLDEAERLYRQMAKASPLQSGWANQGLAVIAIKRGKQDVAEKLIGSNDEGTPPDVRSALELCRKFLSLGLLVAAERHGRLAYRLADERVMKGAVAMELGDALFQQAKFSEARKLLEPLAEQVEWRGLKVRAKALCKKIPLSESKSDF